MIVQVTYEKVNEILRLIEAVDLGKIDEKLNYALVKNYKRLTKINNNSFGEKMLEINLKHCISDKDSEDRDIPRKNDKGEFIFDKKGIQARERDIKELKQELVEVDFYTYPLTPELESYLGLVVVEDLEGLILIREEVKAE